MIRNDATTTEAGERTQSSGTYTVSVYYPGERRTPVVKVGGEWKKVLHWPPGGEPVTEDLKWVSDADEKRIEQGARTVTAAVVRSRIRTLIGKQVGVVRVDKPVERDFRGYECAAWWEKSVSTTGTFPVYLREDHLNKDRLYFSAEVPATVVEDFFQSLYCGVSIGAAYDTKKNAGNPTRAIGITHSLLEGVEWSGFDREGQNWQIAEEVWNEVAEFFHEKVREYLDDLPHWQDRYVAETRDKYESNVGMVAYMGDKLNGYARGAEKVDRKIKFARESYNRKLAPNDRNPELSAAIAEGKLAETFAALEA